MTAPEVASVQDELGQEPPRFGNCGDHVAINPDYADWHRKRADRAEALLRRCDASLGQLADYINDEMSRCSIKKDEKRFLLHQEDMDGCNDLRARIATFLDRSKS